ncbi:cryptochrome/photolyase family protein [Curvivirga aplysinae]|uniref:cryptochrome/photolyase family protein n=1 Tax=Curvivirga aplysinae TaxID=2529852 RepID=UPI0012BC05AB|nr:deoxyribodipyrimidine photo-lyase [Curvivirga aplysinae]MTI08993.1 deoxyribodipyrimidine photo-lyase [Curvivirga aplysinae]
MKKKISIHWFRQDLRLNDNPALFHASKHQNILPIYILDDVNAAENKMGAASRTWLFHSLSSLSNSLNGKLFISNGNPIEVFQNLTEAYEIEAIYWNRCYEPWRIKRDIQIKEHLLSIGIEVKSFNGSLLWEPWQVQKKDGTPYKVFTPFYRKGCLYAQAPRLLYHLPETLNLCDISTQDADIKKLNLLPQIPWHTEIIKNWEIGETGAQKGLTTFLDNGIENYKEGRNFPAKQYVSRLSPYLHFGEISPNQIWSACKHIEMTDHIDHFNSELGWREFSHSLLYFNPHITHQNLQSKFDTFPWNTDLALLEAWKKGQTGIPMVDAGMRELWQTGYMHNRVRMIVGSFLVKNLRLHWKHGERWFWDTLFDADMANNTASWQWIAGCGADAAPYFRIFNPVTQGQKFDPDGQYIRQYVPEIASLPTKYLFAPWEASIEALQYANIILGNTYPKPIVDLKQSRLDALEAFKSLSA